MRNTPSASSSSRNAGARSASSDCSSPGRPKPKSSRRPLSRLRVPVADQTPLLSLHNVCKSFGGIQAVHSITFDVFAGESVGLVGPNGAGKTTLFNCVCGQLRPEQGDIVFDGQALTGLPTFKRARLGIGR